jgi:hypothetical protein
MASKNLLWFLTRVVTSGAHFSFSFAEYVVLGLGTSSRRSFPPLKIGFGNKLSQLAVC